MYLIAYVFRCTGQMNHYCLVCSAEMPRIALYYVFLYPKFPVQLKKLIVQIIHKHAIQKTVSLCDGILY